MPYICSKIQADTVSAIMTADKRPESECSQNLSWLFELRVDTIRITQKDFPKHRERVCHTERRCREDFRIGAQRREQRSMVLCHNYCVKAIIHRQAQVGSSTRQGQIDGLAVTDGGTRSLCHKNHIKLIGSEHLFPQGYNVLQQGTKESGTSRTGCSISQRG